MDQMVTIYGLADPRTGKIRYVGKSKSPIRRLYDHRKEQARHPERNRFFSGWLAKTIPGILILEYCPDHEADYREAAWIAHMRQFQPLANLHPGGTGGATMMGRKHRPDTIVRMRDAALGRQHSQETIEKMRATALANRDNRARAARSRVSKGSSEASRKGWTEKRRLDTSLFARARPRTGGRFVALKEGDANGPSTR